MIPPFRGLANNGIFITAVPGGNGSLKNDE